MKLIRKVGATSQIFQIFIADSSSTTGGGLTGLVFNSSGLTAYYHRDTDTTATAISLVTMTVGTFTSSGFKEIDSTNMPGWYQFCPPNAALASGAASVGIHLKGATNMAPLPIEIDLDAQVDVTLWNGTAVASPATAGIPDVNVKNMNNVAASSITTINANQGTTQPLNFTGTAGSALVKSDMVDVAGAAVSTASAQIGVNVVNLGGTAQTGRDIGASVLLSAGSGTGQLDFTSGVVKSNLVQILGTALTETAGQIAAAFKQFFNISSPTSTMNLITAVTTVTTSTNLTNAPTSGDFTATMKTSLNAATPTASLSALDTLVVQSGTAQAGAASTITLAAGASATDNLYRSLEINIYGGTGAGQSRVITAYVGSTKVATVDEAWITNPDNTSTYKVLEIRAAKLDSSQQVTAASVQGNITGNVGGSVASVTARVTANTDQLAGQTVTAAAGVTFPTSVASPTNITAGTITTATNLTNAPTAGDFTATMKTSLNAATPSVTVSDKTGFSLSSAGVQAIWDALTSALTTAGSIGKVLAALPGSIWDVVLSGHSTAGTTGAALASASSAGDPWATALPGAYASGTAGNIVGNNLNATVSSRFPTASAPANFSSLGITVAGKISEVVLTDTLTTYTGNTPQTGDSFARLGAPVGASISADIAGVPTTVWANGARTLTSFGTLVADTATAVWAAGTRTLTSFGTLVADVATAVWGATSRTLSAFGFTVTTDVSSTVTTNLNATVSSRLATSGYTAPPTAVQNADALLGRTISGGANGGRTVTSALQPLRNKVTSAAGTLTVFAEDDTTTAWTSALTTDPAAEPIVSSDPA